jgi:hypothetical protein
VENFSADEFQHKLHLEGVRDGEVELTPEEVGSLHIAEEIDPVKPREGMSYKELLAFAIKQEDAAQKLYSKLALFKTGTSDQAGQSQRAVYAAGSGRGPAQAELGVRV